jgi:predicted nucleotidyltransferase
LIRRLEERMDALNERLPLLRVVLFGSYARGNYTVASDVDLLVVYQGPAREDAFAVVKKVLGIPGLEPHVYTEGEYRQAEQRIARMTEGGIVLYSR